MHFICYEIPDLGRIPSFESSASLDFCSSSFFLSRKSAQKFAIAFAWIGMRSSLVKVSLPDFSRASLKWPPQSKSDHHDDHFYRHSYLNICNLYCWVETWKGFLEFLFSLIGRFSIIRSPEKSFIERWRFPIKSWNSERLVVVASLVFGLRISTMWKDIRDEFWV